MRHLALALVILIACFAPKRGFADTAPSNSAQSTSPRVLHRTGMILTLAAIGLGTLAMATILAAEFTGGEVGPSTQPALLYTGIASAMTSSILGGVGIPLWCVKF